MRVRITLEYDEPNENQEEVRARLIKTFLFSKLEVMLGIDTDGDDRGISRKFEVIQVLGK